MERGRWTRSDGPRPLGELVAWEAVEADGMLRTTDGALAVTLEVPGADPAAVAARLAPGLADGGWVVHDETVRPPAEDGAAAGAPLRTVHTVTLTRLPLPARRQVVGRRRAGDLLADDLQRQGEMERRVREVRRRLAGRCTLRRLDRRRMLRHLHALVTGREPGGREGGPAPELETLLALPVCRDGGVVRCGDVHLVPVTVAGSGGRDAADGGAALSVDLGDPSLPHRAVSRRSVGHLAASTRSATNLSVKRLVAALAAPPPAARSRVGPAVTVLLVYDLRRPRARRRAAALAARLRDAGVAARVETADPLSVFLASLPARGLARPT